jgi:hypothetical protein
MVKRLLMCSVAVLFLAGIAFTGQQDAAKAGSWTGWVTDSNCGAKGAKAEHAACARKCVDEHGANYTLFNQGNKKSYYLDSKEKVAEFAGQQVTVQGTLEADTIHVTSIAAIKTSGS